MKRMILLTILLGNLFLIVSSLACKDEDRVAQRSKASELRDTSKDYILNLSGGANLEMIWIPGGEFEMGSAITSEETAKTFGGEVDQYKPEHPRHSVPLDGFWMSKYEITNAQYRSYMSSHPGDNLDNEPVVLLTWNDSNDFCDWLTTKTGSTYTLPTEAQWEYACRAGSETEYFWGNDWDPNFGNAKFKKDGYEVIAPVGSFEENAFGLCDMSGNVWEWCSDFFDESYYSTPSALKKNPQGPDTGEDRVLRGGSWFEPPALGRSAARYWLFPDLTSVRIGFRVVRIPEDLPTSTN